MFVRLRAATFRARGAVAMHVVRAAKHAPPPPSGPLRVLMLASQPASHAGTLHRLGLWAARLRRAGHEVELSLPVEGAQGEHLYVQRDLRSRARQHLLTLASRRRAAAVAPAFDVAIIHMTDLPYWEYGTPFFAEAIARTAGRVVLDLDDLPVVRGETAPGPRARRLVATADGLVLGNRALQGWFPDRRSWLVPTCIEPSAWPVADRGSRVGPPVLGWIGTAGGLRALEDLAPQLAAACARHGARLRVVCDVPPTLPGVPLDFVPWAGGREAEDLATIDVGLAPVREGPDTRCKCGLKALLSMASGAPVIASPVGALADIVVHGGTGFHATTPAQWGEALEALLSDRALRLRQGAAGRAAAIARWSYDVHEPTFMAALRGVPA